MADFQTHQEKGLTYFTIAGSHDSHTLGCRLALSFGKLYDMHGLHKVMTNFGHNARQYSRNASKTKLQFCKHSQERII